ncbi:MAG TPA: EAL domain-containing protein [Rhizomicrobium sp.]|nr:EAL domain-containing protein [Rhizomicrobium sp.]
MPHRARLLGFAFASADFLFEVDRDGNILFATGAASDFAPNGAEALKGQNTSSLFEPMDANRFLASVRGLGVGRRAGPMRARLISGKDGSVSMLRLPLNPNTISCTLMRSGSAPSFEEKSDDPQTGLASRDSFLDEANRVSKESDSLTLVDIPGLAELSARMPEADAAKLFAAIGGAAKASGAKAAGRLSDNTFGAVTNKKNGADFVGRIRRALFENGAGKTQISETELSMKGEGLSAGQRLLAVRYVVERFMSGKKMRDCSKDLATSFGAMMNETEERMRDVAQTVNAGNFAMAYQPIVSLRTGELSHYESLVRFEANKTAETVTMVEQLGMASSFDLAVTLKVIAALTAEKDKSLRVAVNLSGHTIASPQSFGLIAGILARHRALASRLLIEITETAEITDLESANKAVGALREMGFKVGLDDFGAGAASLNYLHGFSVDFVKFDGSLVKKLGTSERDDTLLRGMLKLCGELGMYTIAECIETQEQADMAREIGFNFGQGYFLGKPQEKPDPEPKGSSVARRRGIREDWS